jgi:predicted transposase/invertase (TIGR01784 family)
LPEPTNIHDLVFKETLSRLKTAIEFLANYLPEKITALLDLGSAERLPDSFVDPELREHFSDLLYRVKLKGGGNAFVFVLMEHKSSPDEAVAFQLLRYIVRIWEKHGRGSKGKLPPVFPIVFYHGGEKWRVARNLSAMIELGDGEAFREYSPDLKYYLCNLQDYAPADIRGGARLQMVLLAMKYIFSQDVAEKLAEILRVFGRFPKDDLDAIESIRTVLIYWSKTRGLSRDDVERALEQDVPREAGDVMATFVDEYREEGIKLGIERGIEQGRRKEAVTLTLRLLLARFGPAEPVLEEAIRALPLELLEDLGVALLGFNSEADLAEWVKHHNQ